MHTSRRLVQICALFLLLIGGSSAHAQERDLWYVLSQGEQAISSNHVQVQVASPGDGTFRGHRWDEKASLQRGVP